MKFNRVNYVEKFSFKGQLIFNKKAGVYIGKMSEIFLSNLLELYV